MLEIKLSPDAMIFLVNGRPQREEYMLADGDEVNLIPALRAGREGNGQLSIVDVQLSMRMTERNTFFGCVQNELSARVTLLRLFGDYASPGV